MKLFATQYEVLEWAYSSEQTYADPFNEVEFDAVLTHEAGQSWRVPAFWAGGQEWRVRFAPPLPGKYQVTAEIRAHGAGLLGGQKAELEASPFPGNPSLLQRGALKVAATKRTLEYADGTPFFWLGDTWWMGFVKRLSWPDDFQQLAADRLAKGFSVIQIVAGLYPDMPAFDPRGENEAGFPWEQGWARIRPAYFDMADLRIRHLAKVGLVPCVVSGWGYYLPFLGVKKMKQHWRNLVARWGAYPVIWCLAGEVLMPYYLSEHKEEDVETQKKGWAELVHYLREIDPYQRPITIHDHLLEGAPTDVNMLQTGHDGYRCISNTVKMITEGYQREPAMPVLVGESNYEGIIHGTGAEIQRLTFWSSVLCGACGFTYGGNGLWQVNTPHQPYGASPWGGTWGGGPWQEVIKLPGAAQLGLAKRFLERFRWWKFEPHPEWVEPSASPQNVDLPFAAGIPGEVRVIYFYWPTFQRPSPQHRVLGLEKNVSYRAYFWNPRSGVDVDLGQAVPEADGSWYIPIQPELKDWVVVLERTGS